ncbi:MAG: PP2C family protein-serine/threonine phosphatase [Fluviicola sp.]
MVLPAVDLILIIVCGVTSENPWLTVPLNFIFPIFGVGSILISERLNSRLPFIISMIILSFYGILFAYLLGPDAPGWLMAITYIVAVTFFFDKSVHQFMLLGNLFVGVIIVEWHMGLKWNELVVILGCLLCFVLLIVSSVNFLIKQQLKVKEQKLELEQKNQEITDSIQTAKRIQYSLLSDLSQLPEHFETACLFIPKDIVSGDFYWTHFHQGYWFIAVCDSTGHGVPGAMMSTLNISLLNEALLERNLLDPGAIFDYVRSKLRKMLDETTTKDGMDGCLLRIDPQTNEIRYAAANNPPILISDNGQYTVLEKDRMPIGYSIKEDPFTTFQFHLKKDQSVILLTDGWQDQFGGTHEKKWKAKSVYQALSNSVNEPLKSGFLTTFSAYQSTNEQVDDLCLIRLKLVN